MHRFILLLSTAFIAVSCLDHIGAHLKRQVSDQKFHDFLRIQSQLVSTLSCPNFESQIQNITRETEHCIVKQYHENKEGICDFWEHGLRPCIEPIRTLLVKCLPEKSKDLPTFIVDVLMALLRSICNAKGYELLELTQPCITHSLSEPNPCRLQLDMKLVEFSYQFPTKSEFCALITTYRTCLEGVFEERCPSPVTRRNFFKFYDSIRGSCKK